MYCSNCKTDVTAVNGYCERCGMSVQARLCPNGHVMDPSWTECQNCPPEARASGGAAKDTTVVESPRQAGDFTTAATLLEGDAGGAPAPRQGSSKARTVVDSGGPGPSSSKKKTVFDSASAAAGGAVQPARGPESRLVGWLVSFSLNPAGSDYRVREGRNTIGADAEECDILISESPTVSSRHAVLMYRDGKFLLRDSDSTNGTYLNGRDIFGEGAVPVSNLDRIKFGNVECALYAIQTETAEA